MAKKDYWQGIADYQKENPEMFTPSKKPAPAQRVMIAVGFKKIGDEINGNQITGFGKSWRMSSDDDRVYQVLGSPDAGTGSFSVCYAYFA